MKYVYAATDKKSAKKLTKCARKMGYAAYCNNGRVAIEFDGFRRTCLEAGILPATFGAGEGWDGWVLTSSKENNNEDYC
ncbi:MAG: hypothetical protein QXU75_06620 [Candidatus Methanomethylicaceae archaeon]